MRIDSVSTQPPPSQIAAQQVAMDRENDSDKDDSTRVSARKPALPGFAGTGMGEHVNFFA